MLAWLKLDIMLGSISKFAVASLFLATFSITGCGDDPVKKGVATGCTLNSDCDAGLVCSFALCHEECEATKDCPSPQRCVKTEGANVCQLNTETKCNFNSDCKDPLVCAIDRQCRNQCQADKDCLGGQKCADNVCAEPAEVDDDGNLVGAVGNGGAGGEGNMSTGGSGGSGGSGGGTGGSLGVGGDTGEGGAPPAECVPGGDCVPENDPCKVGVVECNGGVETCAVATDADDGEECGANKVCSGGECVACKVNEACQPEGTDVCKTGKLSCANGPMCDVSGDAQNGTDCGTDKVCALGACVACKVGDSCQPANTCKNGTWACAAGPVCNPTTNKSAGTDCDTGKVCDSQAACVACVADAACEPTNECHQGKQTCATGPNCVDTELPAADGTSCAGSAPYNFCTAGTCAACTTGASCVPANPCHKGTLNCATTPPTCNEQNVNVADGLACGDNKSCISGACVTNNRVLSITSGAVADVAVDAPFANVSVKLVDANNTPLAGVALTVVPAAGAYAVASAGTNASGVAQISGRVGRAVGSYKFTVSAPGASSVEFTAKAIAPSAKDIFTLVNVNTLRGPATVPGAGTVSKLDKDARAVTSAADGTLYIAAQCGVYKLNTAGVLTHVAGVLSAGSDTCGSSGDTGAGSSVQLSTISGLALDEANGYLYIADDGNFKVRQLDLGTGNILTFAGNASAPNTAPYGDGGPADSAYVRPSGVSVAPNGDVYISDWYTNRLRKVDFQTGIISSIFTQVGCNQNNALSFYDCGSYGDACTAAWDKDGKLFLAARFCGGGQTYFYGVVRVEADKTLSLVAGKQGNTPTPAEGGTATSAIWSATPTIAFDKAGNLFLGARADHRIHRVDSATTRITTVAGLGTPGGYSGDYGPGTAAAVKNPSTISFDVAGNLYFADSGNWAIRGLWGVGSTVAPTATLAKLAGSTDQTVKLDASFAPLSVKLTDGANANIAGVDISWKRMETGSGFFSTGASSVTTKTIATGVSSQAGRVGLAAGNYTFQASYSDIHGVPVTGSPQTFTVVAEAPATGTIFPVVNYVHTSGSEGVPGPATFTKLLNYAHGVAVATDGTMYVSDHCSVYKITPRGEISVFAGGTGCGTVSGDSGPAVGAKMSTVYALALDEPREMLYIADNGNSRIRMVSLTTGVIDTLAGGGTINVEPYGDNGQATAANIGGPFSVSVDPNGLVYVPDYSHNRIRVINPETGIITTWLMGSNTTCVQGVVSFRNVQHLYTTVRFKADGDAYVSGSFCQGTDTNFINPPPYAIVLRAKANGTLTRVAGLYNGIETEGADALASALPTLSDFAIEANGNLVLALAGDNRVRRITMQTGKINTIAGNGTAGYALPTDVSAEPGAYVPATSALLKTAWKVAVVPGGHVLIADRDNQAVRMIW